MEKKKELFGWFEGSKKRTYTTEELDDLIRRIKKFNAGAIDEYLSNHVDKAYETWKKELGGK